MRNSALKRCLFFGILIAGSIVGGLLSCGRKETIVEKKEVHSQQVFLDGELQWEAGLSWDFFPWNGSADNGKTGCFVSEEGRKQRMKAAKQEINETMEIWQDKETIEVYHNTLSEEDFFLLINNRAKELVEKYPEEEVVYRINGSTEIDQFVQLDAGREHRLYIRLKDSVYILYGEMRNEIWQDFLEEWMSAFDLKWNGLAVMKEEGTISDTYTGQKIAGMRRMIQCGKDCMRMDGYVILFHRQEEGFYIKSEDIYDERNVDEILLYPVENYPQYTSGEEMLAYFRDRYPDMYRLEAYFCGQYTSWDLKVKMIDHIFWEVADGDGFHGFFPWNGEIYEMLIQSGPDRFPVIKTARRQMGYDDHSFFSWLQEDGNVSQYDLLTNTYFYRKDLGGGEVVRIQAERAEGTSEDTGNNDNYQVKIFDEKKNELLQEIQVHSSEREESPFIFEDFNADGYLDLTVIESYGGHNNIAYHYIFSPSKREFVKLDPELDYRAYVDSEMRRLYFHFYFLQIYGLEVTYQWKNEMDYEVTKRFLHDETEGGVLVKISRYEDGKEEFLSDYIYSYEEYTERDDIWGTYYEDFIWEKEVTDRSTGKKYMIRYAEVFLPEEAERNKGIYYDGRIYVYDENTYLVSVTHSEIISKSKSITWEDGDGDKVQAVVICYDDGGKSVFYLSGLIQPDYQPADL